MKLNRNDLSPDIIAKLDRLDSAITTKNNTVVSYDGQKFISIPLEASKPGTNTVIVEKRIVPKTYLSELKDRIYRPKKFDHSSLFEDMSIDSTPHIGTANCIKEINTNSLMHCSEGIFKTKNFGNYIFVLDTNRIITRVDETETVRPVACSILELINNSFAVKLNKKEILSFSILNEKILFFTTTNGIYKVNIEEKSIEYVISDGDILFTDILGDFLLTFKYEEITVFRLKDLVRIKKFFNVRNSFMIPFKSLVKDDTLLLLTKTVVTENLFAPLFIFKLDESKSNIDYKRVILNNLEQTNSITFDQIAIDNKTVSLVGRNKKEELSILNYNLETMEDSIMVVNELFKDEITSVFSSLDTSLKRILISSNKKIYQINDGKIIARLAALISQDIFVINGNFIGVDEFDIRRLEIPKYSTTNTVAKYKVPFSSRNIDFLFDTDPATFDCDFVTNDGTKVLPEKIVKLDDIGVFVSIKNVEVLKDLEFRFNLSTNTVLNGFIVIDNETF